MNPNTTIRTALWAVCALSCTVGCAQTADTIYTGGAIITINDAAPSAEALAVKDGKILAVGAKADVLKTQGATTKLVNLGGKTLLPGFIDAHGHVFNVGVQAAAANLLPPPDGECGDIAAIQRVLKTWAEKNQAKIERTGWIIGNGYDDGQLKEQRPPNRDELDAVSTKYPVVAIHQSGHLAVLNSKALAAAGYTAATKNPPGGVIRRRAGSDEPDGVLEEMAFFQVIFKVLAGLNQGDNKALLKSGVEVYASFGYTTAQEGRATTDAVATEAAVAAEGGLKLDVAAFPDMQGAPDAIKSPLASLEYKNHFRIAGVKLSLDGSPQGKTAWLTKPYLVPPAGQKADYTGYAAIPEAEAIAYVDQAFKNGWQIHAHCAGDAAADLFIKAVRVATAKYGKADRRPVMIHAHTAREDQIDAMKELGIIPSFFSMHTFYWGDWHRDSVLGPERAENFAPAGWALKRGMRFTQHHDAPVALPSSLMIIDTQVNRLTRTGKVLGPDQRVPVMDALKSITIHAAYQYFEEKTKGSLELGKLADLVILDKNPLTVDPKTLKDIKVIETIKEGKTIYNAAAH